MKHLQSLVSTICRWLLLGLVAVRPVSFQLGRRGPRWTIFRRGTTLRILPSIAGGAPDEDEDDDDADRDRTGDEDDDADRDRTGDEDEAPRGKERDWKREARRKERELKSAQRARAEAEEKLARATEANRSERERELDRAKKDVEAAVRAELEADRRGERLENKALALAARGVKVTVKEDGRDVERVLKFEDPDDAVTFLERAIKNRDTSMDELFDADGKIDGAALSEVLADILSTKPKLAAGDNGGGGGRGSNDASRGGSAPAGDLESLSIDELYKDHVKGK